MENEPVENEEFMTDQLAQIRERAEKATKGPWLKDAELDDTEVIYVPLASVAPDAVSVLFKADWATPEDVEFAAHARTDIPFLLDFAATIRAETLEKAAKIVESHQCSELKSSEDVRPLTQMIATAIRDAGRKGL